MRGKRKPCIKTLHKAQRPCHLRQGLELIKGTDKIADQILFVLKTDGNTDKA